MRLAAVFLFCLLVRAQSSDSINDPVFKPLWGFQGTWEVTRKSLPSGAKADKLINQCALVGRFFSCQQSVNGGRGVLLLILPGDLPNHYFTQTIMADGRVGGRDDLEIDGDHWTFSSRRQEQPGKFTYYRTTNLWLAKNRIHYEQGESADGKNWTTKDSGDEVRTTNGLPIAAR